MFTLLIWGELDENRKEIEKKKTLNSFRVGGAFVSSLALPVSLKHL